MNKLGALLLIVMVVSLIPTACAPEKVVETVVVKEKVVETVVVKETVVKKETVIQSETVIVEVTAPPPSQYSEAPDLAEKVAAGQLPPVDERLPKNPKVVVPEDEVGKYGGTWRAGLRGGGDDAWLHRTLSYEYLVRWTRDWTGIAPNVAESWEVNDDSTEFIFHLREGLKWSDGVPFTADDIMFWYEDFIMNEELSPAPPAALMAGGEPVVIEKIDDYTVKWSFAAPKGFLLLWLASADGYQPTNFPRHYAEQFHIKYNPDANDQAVAAGYEDWAGWFDAKVSTWNARFRSSEFPNLWAWDITQAYGDTTTRVVAERNPYYFKVDTAGNQLPYIDRVVYDVGDEVETLVLKALNGEIDFQDRHIATSTNKAVFFDNQEQGGYRLTTELNADSNVMEISFNLNHLDPVKNEVFNNKDFRVGLSHAINRQEIIDVVYVGQGEPWQAAPMPISPYYVEGLGEQYLEYDVDLANEYLDKVLPEKDAEGFRLGPDGNRFSFTIDVITALALDHIDNLELIQGYWQEVGIDMTPNVIDRDLQQARLDALEHDANVWGAPSGIGFGALLDPRNWIPMHGHSRYGRGWVYWRENPNDERAVEPPDYVQEQYRLYDLALAASDPLEQAEYLKQAFEIAKEQFYCIGISKPAPKYGIANVDLKNIFEPMPAEWQYPTPGPADPEQWYFDR